MRSLAELENQKKFSSLLSSGVKALKQHPDYKTNREAGNKTGQSYMEKIAYKLGVSPNTVKSWIGQMGSKYIPGRIEDAKLFGIIWLILEKGCMNVTWFMELLETTSIPVIEPALPAWVASCLKKAKTMNDNGTIGTPPPEEINMVITRLFGNAAVLESEEKNKFSAHNLPARWSGRFIGRKSDLQAIYHWLLSPSPVCSITGWAGVGKTTLALEAAYACAGEPGEEAANVSDKWPAFHCIIWFSTHLTGLSFNDFLNTIAYQLGLTEQIDKPVMEKRFAVRHALQLFSREQPILLIVDSMDAAEKEVLEFIINLPQGVKAMLTSRENYNQDYKDAFQNFTIVKLKGLNEKEALSYLSFVIREHLQTGSAPNQEELRHLTPEMQAKLIKAAAGNPKALSLCIAYISDGGIPAEQLIQEIESAGYSLLELFEFLFGRTWKRIDEAARRLWQVLCFFEKPPVEAAWAAAAGLDARGFYAAVEQMRNYALIHPDRTDGKLRYPAHQTVIAYGEQHLSENRQLEKEARKRWARYYIHFLDTHLKREQPNIFYWRYLLGRDLDDLKQEWTNIRKVMEWASQSDEKEILIEFVVRTSHFLSRVNLPLRVEYGRKAADFAAALDKSMLEAFFRIDTVGWALMEMNELEEALIQIDAGLKRLSGLDAGNEDTRDLMVWGHALKSRVLLKAGDPDQAEAILSKVIPVPSTPMIRHRVLLVQGDLYLERKKYKEAIRAYEAANQISHAYGGEKTIEAYFNLGIAYVENQQFEKAAAAFEKMLYQKNKANPIELMYYHYGMARLFAKKGDLAYALYSSQEALHLAASWEQNISIRDETEKFNQFIKKKIQYQNG